MDPLFADFRLTTTGPGFHGGMSADCSAKIEQDMKERKDVRFLFFIRKPLPLSLSRISQDLTGYCRASRLSKKRGETSA